MLLESVGRAAAVPKKSRMPKPALENFLGGKSIVCHHPARHNGAQGRTAAPVAKPSTHLCTKKRWVAIPQGWAQGETHWAEPHFTTEHQTAGAGRDAGVGVPMCSQADPATRALPVPLGSAAAGGAGVGARPLKVSQLETAG